MASDEPDDRKLDLGEELELSSADGEQERLRQRQLAAIPGRAKSSRVVRKVILGRGVAPERLDRKERHKRLEREEREEQLVQPSDDVPEADHGLEPASEPAPPVAGEEAVGPATEEGDHEPGAPAPSGLAWDAPEGDAQGRASLTQPGRPRRRRRGGAPNAEAEWTGSRGTLWWVLAGICGVLLIGLFLRYELQQSGTKAPLQAPYRPPESAGIDATPIASFVRQSADLLPVILERIAAVGSPEGKTRADLYRRGEESLAKVDDWNRRVPALAAFNPAARYDLHASAITNTGYLTLEGWRSDYTRALIYFVAQDDDYLLDWEATVGYSEVLPAECEKLADQEPRLMRCIVGPSLYYTDIYPEERFVCYALHHRDPGSYVWAYVERGTSAAVGMEAHISFNLRPPLAGRATLMVRRGRPGARPRQVEITDFLHAGWVTPEEGGTEEPGSGLEKAGGE